MNNIPSMLFEKRRRCEDCFAEISLEQLRQEISDEQIGDIVFQWAAIRTDEAIYRRRRPESVRDWARPT